MVEQHLPLGIFSIDPSTGVLVYENSVSSGNDGTSGAIKIYSLLSIGETEYYCGRDDSSESTTQSLDIVYEFETYADSTAYFETGLVKVSDGRNKRRFNHMMISLAKYIPDDHSVTVYYREKLTDSYIQIGKIDQTIDGNISEKYFENLDTNTIQVNYLQLKVVLNAGGADTGSPELIEVRLI